MQAVEARKMENLMEKIVLVIVIVVIVIITVNIIGLGIVIVIGMVTVLVLVNSSRCNGNLTYGEVKRLLLMQKSDVLPTFSPKAPS